MEVKWKTIKSKTKRKNEVLIGFGWKWKIWSKTKRKKSWFRSALKRNKKFKRNEAKRKNIENETKQKMLFLISLWLEEKNLKQKKQKKFSCFRSKCMRTDLVSLCFALKGKHFLRNRRTLLRMCNTGNGFSDKFFFSQKLFKFSRITNILVCAFDPDHTSCQNSSNYIRKKTRIKIR